MNTLPSTIDKMVDRIVVLNDAVIDLQRSVLALGQALANQPNVDRARLAQDVAVALQLAGADLAAPSKQIAALLTSVRTPHEQSRQLSLGEKLLRAESLRNDPDQR